MNREPTASQRQESYQRISRSLPALRGLAIIWIVAYHLMGNTRGYLNWSAAIATLSQNNLKSIIETVLEIFISAGSTGVNVFLVISGFGLTASWWKKYGSQGVEQMPLLSFWKRRILRIVPQFWAAVVIALILYAVNPSWAPFGQSVWQQGPLASLLAIATTLSTLRNFIPEHYYFLNGAWWYVGLSIQLYLVFPYLIRYGCRYGWLKLLSASLLFSLAYRAAVLFSPISGGEEIVLLAFFPARIFEFVLGMYLAIALLNPSKQATKLSNGLNHLLLRPQLAPVSAFIFLVGLIFKWLPYPSTNIFAEALIALGLFCALVSCTQLKILQKDSISRTIGKYSYGIYLTHMNVYLILWPAAAVVPSYWLRFGLVMVMSCLIGLIFELAFTSQSQIIKSSFTKSKAP